ncbi:MAG: excinuclease ABC subunit UvrA [Bdellovibrionaceae bacterium]|nr:excinuclease ABC subunit UvrA [Pseudobdellovibrionaceae bacterium]
MPNEKINDFITIKNAREHNLKDVNIQIPRNKITVLTGLSGSGKSSLAFDTIYAEGQRRYIDSLSSYAKNFLDQLKKPDLDSITGLSPALAIDQKSAGTNPRSTVGTITEIYDYLRLLFAKVGVPECPTHHIPVASQTPQDMLDGVVRLGEGAKVFILAPMAQNKKGEFLNEFQRWFKKGFIKAKVDGVFIDLDKAKKLAKTKAHTIDLVIDQVIVKDGARTRIAESLNTAIQMADGQVVIETIQGKRTLFSLKSSCPVCGFAFPELEPRLFSFNNPRGYCETCKGLGTLDFVEEEVYSDGDEGNRKLNQVKYVYKNQSSSEDDESEEFEPEIRDCPDCQGNRLKPESLNIKIAEKNIVELSQMNLTELQAWLEDYSKNKKLKERERFLAEKIIAQIQSRIQYLLQVGTGYLSLNRSARTLSGGESQRIRLATQVGSSLIGILYVMDEPSIGLHPRDHHRLLKVIKELRDRGNTVLLVEHDEDTIRAADFVVDLGPGAGKYGGEILAQGSPEEIEKNKKSITGQYLSGQKRVPIPTKRRPGNGKFIEIKGARGNNLKNVNVKIPLGLFLCVTGVSGSGKSTLIMDTLYKHLAAKFYRAQVKASAFDSIEGLDNIDKVIEIDQKPIGRTPRSTPATYVGLLPLIRELYAQIPEAKLRGYGPGRFSFNTKGGRCEACQGHGQIRMEMHFLTDVYVPCDVCQSKRYNKETLVIKYKDKNISDVLEMSVIEALEFFKNHSLIHKKLETLNQVGLGYMTLGQSSTTLSGGEAQRVKLSKELSKRSTGKTLYILDEPTTGLHFEDIRKLVELLQELTNQGNTVLVIEHNLEVIKTADHIMDLGPDGGNGGGQIVVTGTPEVVAKNARSEIAKFLKPILGNSGVKAGTTVLAEK